MTVPTLIKNPDHSLQLRFAHVDDECLFEDFDESNGLVKPLIASSTFNQSECESPVDSLQLQNLDIDRRVSDKDLITEIKNFVLAKRQVNIREISTEFELSHDQVRQVLDQLVKERIVKNIANSRRYMIHPSDTNAAPNPKPTEVDDSYTRIEDCVIELDDDVEAFDDAMETPVSTRESKTSFPPTIERKRPGRPTKVVKVYSVDTFILYMCTDEI